MNVPVLTEQRWRAEVKVRQAAQRVINARGRIALQHRELSEAIAALDQALTEQDAVWIEPVERPSLGAADVITG